MGDLTRGMIIVFYQTVAAALVVGALVGGAVAAVLFWAFGG